MAEISENERPDWEGFLAGVDALELLPDYQRLVQAEAENFGN